MPQAIHNKYTRLNSLHISGLWFDFQFFLFQFPFSNKCWERGYYTWRNSHTPNLKGFYLSCSKTHTIPVHSWIARRGFFERGLRISAFCTEEGIFFENVRVFHINDLRFSWHCLWRLTFWDMKPCWVEISHRNFGECFCIHL